MIIIISFICVSLVLVSLIYYRNYRIQNENNQDIRTFLLADSIEEDDYNYNPDLI
jgi:hypothetical protein